MRRIRRHLTYANVMSSIAVFTALATGGAYASHLMVDSSDVVDNSLRSADILDKGVWTIDLAANAVTNTRLAPETVLGEDIASGAVGTTELAPESVDGSRVENGSLRKVDLGVYDPESTLSNPVLDAGRCTTIPASVPDAVDTDIAVADPIDTWPSGVVVTVRGTRAGFVDFAVCNHTGSNIADLELKPARWRVLLFRGD